MMKNLKKIVALLLSVILTMACLAGCGGSTSGSGGKKNTEQDVEIAVWNSGGGVEWLDALIDGFNKKHPEYNVYYSASANSDAVSAAFGMEDVDTVDLYLTYMKSTDTTYMEPLDEIVLDQTADGDKTALREKFKEAYLAMETSVDGKIYTLTSGGGIVSFFYNKELFEQAGIKQLPRTTNEFIVVCDTLYSKGITPMCHFAGEGYYEYLTQVFMVQYDGLDYYQNQFYACVDDAGNSPSKDVFLKKDGRYEALKVYEKIVTPEYTLLGSNTKSHTEIQTEFINDKAAMMLNGSWLQNEMKNAGTVDKLGEMRLPVLSSITSKLTTVKNDNDLRKLVSAIDQVTDGEKQLSDFASGNDYLVEGKTVSAADWETVSAARNTIATNYSGHDAFIPKYSNAKEGAIEFMKYMYSDEGYKIFTETSKTPYPMKLSTGEAVDTSSFNNFEKYQFTLMNTAEQMADSNASNKHRIFTDGGAKDMAGITFIDKFSSQNPADRKSADQVWDLITAKVNDDYEANWLKNIK